MSGSRQHYFPASLIGNFGTDTSGPRRRRRVYFARRGVNQVLRKRAEECGVMPGHEQVYEDLASPGPGIPLDQLWGNAEGGLASVDLALRAWERDEAVPAEIFVSAVAPYLAHLLARHPRLEHPTWSLEEVQPVAGVPRLSNLMHPEGEVNEQVRRYGLMGAMADVVLFGVRWSVALASLATPWTTTDFGVAWLPGRGIGTHLIPISARHAVVLGPGSASYVLGMDSVAVRAYEWSAEDVNFVNDVLALDAPREVYSATEPQAEHAVSIWADAGSLTQRTEGFDARVVAKGRPEGGPWLLLQGMRYDPGLSWGRFLTANHQFGCSCSIDPMGEADNEGGPTASYMHASLAEAARSLRGSQALYPEPVERMVGSVVSDTGEILIANRLGLKVIKSTDPIGYARTPRDATREHARGRSLRRSD